MPAAKGNNYWQFRNKHGKDHSYTPATFWDEALKYFEWMQNSVWNKNESIKSGDLAGTIIPVPITTPMTISGFCLFADIDESTFDNYLKGKGYDDYFRITNTIKSIIETKQFEGATIGVFNPNIIARKLGLTDKSDVTTNGKEITKQLPIINVQVNGNNTAKIEFANSEDEVDV